jgi:tRNA nucleotidyltransferase (CCA-adding enzyme)
MRGDGNGFSSMPPIIHDFLCYNIRMSRDLSDLLERSISTDRLDLIRRAAEAAGRLGLPLYLVGGFVRDLLLGRPAADFDLVVEGDAITLARALAKKFGGKVTAHTKFGTAKMDVREWKPESAYRSLASIDLISSRSETYKHPGALPTVKPGSMDDDLRRRDFTINTLAIRLDGPRFGELRDDLGGLSDLERGIVHVLHPRSFVDDPTRMYRAVRYEARYGFRISSETLRLIPEARALIDKLSAQRIRHELDLILEEPEAGPILGRLAELDLLKPVHPALGFDDSASRRLAHVPGQPSFDSPDFSPGNLRWMLWLMSSSKKEIESVNKRLHFTSSLMRSLLAASKLFADLPSYEDLGPSQCVERLDGIPLSAVYAVSRAAPGKPKEKLEKYLGEWRHVKPHTTGHDLKKLGIPPGPKYQKVLRELRRAWLDGKLHSVHDEERLLENLLEDSGL